MKRIIRLIVLITCATALFSPAEAQDRSSQITPTYRFEYRLTSKSDTMTTLYCVIKSEEIYRFVKINVTYNDKTRQYLTRNLMQNKTADFFLLDNMVYIKIMEQLEDPFVLIEGEDRAGRKIVIKEKGADGSMVNSNHAKENWKKAMARIDSMDFARNCDKDHNGKDGKSKYTNKMMQADGSAGNQSLSTTKTVTLTPSKDAYLYMTAKPGYDYYATTNYGTSPRFYSGEWSASNYRVNQRSVLDFDMASIPADAVIVDARLTLYSMTPQTNDDYKHSSSLIKPNSVYKSNASYIERITTPWSELAVTYSTQPATSTSNRLAMPESQTSDENYIGYDVTGMVQDMVVNPGESFGFMLRLQNEVKYSRMAFCSREFPDSSRWPKLEVTYIIADEMSTFYHHSFVLKTDGSLWGWGGNVNGEIGDGTKTDKYSQVKIGTNEWKQASTGYNHSMAIKTDGSLWMWGANFVGQLGDGTLAEKIIPTRLGTANNWRQVTGGFYYSLAIKTDGTLWAWGINDKGQLGTGYTTNRNTPGQIGPTTNWKMVVTRNNFTLALKKDSTLWAWGCNDRGQLGDGTTIDKHAPVQIGTEKNWKTISAGWDHALAIKYDGTLWGWGRDNYGQLADSSKTTHLIPFMIDNSTDWKDVSAGYQHSMAMKADGTVYSWGYNYYGQLGNGDDGNATFSINAVEGMTNCSMIGAGYFYSLIMNPDGSYCGAGENTAGQLGDGTNVSRFVFACENAPASEMKTMINSSAAEETILPSDEDMQSNLQQNYPNPATGTTTIDCYVAEDAAFAKLVVYNISGFVVGQYPIASKGNSSVTLDLQDLPSGVYFYTMLVDGNAVSDRRRMVVIR